MKKKKINREEFEHKYWKELSINANHDKTKEASIGLIYDQNNKIIDSDAWESNQKRRNIPDDQKFIGCFASFNHLRMNRFGGMGPCCFGLVKQTWTKEKGLHDYWFNGVNLEYQEAFLQTTLHKDGCRVCINKINRNVNPHLNDYDWNVHDRMKAVTDIRYPEIIDFEISNLCNLECPMCWGYLSSKHAMNRDSFVDWGVNVFDDDDNLNHLIEELKEFIPHLKEMRFEGGEPLAHKAMYKIADIIHDINPKVILNITTNGTIYNKKVERLIKNNNVRFSFSIDNVIPDEYEKIRVGAKYEDTFANIEKIKSIIGPRNITISTVFHIKTIEQIEKFFRYGIENKFNIFINTYDRHGRSVYIPDWRLHLIDKKIRKNVIKQCEDLLKEVETNTISKLSSYIKDKNKRQAIRDKIHKIKEITHNWESQLKKIILLIEESLDLNLDDRCLPKKWFIPEDEVMTKNEFKNSDT